MTRPLKLFCESGATPTASLRRVLLQLLPAGPAAEYALSNSCRPMGYDGNLQQWLDKATLQ